MCIRDRIQINHSGNGSFPVSGNASACSMYGLFPSPCCLSDNAVPVSYTHLDLYKRQVPEQCNFSPNTNVSGIEEALTRRIEVQLLF